MIIIFRTRAGKRRDDLRLHFHGFEHGETVADSYGVAHLDRDGNDHGWSRSMHHASVVAVDLMRHAVHLDARPYSLADRDDVEFAAEDNEPGFKLIQAVDVGLDPYAVDLDAVISRADAVRFDGVEVAATAQRQDAANVTLHARPAACGGCVKLRLLDSQFGVVGIDGSLDQRDVRIFSNEMPIFRREAVEPTDIDVAALHFFAAQHFQQEGFVAGAALDDDHALAQRPPEPGQRFFAGLAGGDHLGDHGIELMRNAVAFGDAGIHAHTGTGHHAKAFENAWGGREIVVRILGIEAHLHGVTETARGITFETLAPRNVDLQFHEIDAGGAFGDRMLNL